MERLEYEIEIAAPVKKVWETMLQKETYEQWVSRSWPDSSYKGKWEKGTKISFVGPDGSGTLAEIAELIPNKRVLAVHVAALGPGGVEDRQSDMAKGWIGTKEEYQFTEQDGKTKVKVTIETTPEWTSMFDEGWPAALAELKALSERQAA